MITHATLKVYISTGNSAVVKDPGGELGRLLRQIANRIDAIPTDEERDEEISLRDLNGNVVGHAFVSYQTD